MWHRSDVMGYSPVESLNRSTLVVCVHSYRVSMTDKRGGAGKGLKGMMAEA